MFDSFIAFLQAILTVFYNISGYIGFANYGVAIILMTIVIKILLYPLTVKQIKSMKAMQDLQPKMKELQEKFKDKPVIVCCASGMRSAKASGELAKLGFVQVHSLAGGVDAWVGAGYPIKKGTRKK